MIMKLLVVALIIGAVYVFSNRMNPSNEGDDKPNDSPS